MCASAICMYFRRATTSSMIKPKTMGKGVGETVAMREEGKRPTVNRPQKENQDHSLSSSRVSAPLCLAVQRERQKEKPDPITFRFIAMLVIQRHRLRTGSQEAQKVLPCVASIVLQFFSFSFLHFPPQHIKVKLTKNILRTFPAGFHAVKR